MSHRAWSLMFAAAIAACGGAPQSSAPAPSPPPIIKLTAISTLSKSDLAALAAAFPDKPFSGGQVVPFVAKSVTDSTFIFVQFDRPNVGDATGVAYLGVGVKGAFCSQSQPDASGGSFPVF